MAIAANFPSIKPSLNLDFANVGRLDPRVTFTRASTARYYDGVTTAKAEENLLTYSQEFDNSDWTKTNSTVTANATNAPDGTATAEKLISNNAATDGRATQLKNVSGNVVFSVFAKADEWDWVLLAPTGGTVGAYFDLTNGVVGTQNTGYVGTITSVGNGWYRCSVAYTGSGTNQTVRIYPSDADGSISTGDGTSGLFLWGAQLEQRSAVTAYTATTTQPITNYVPVLLTAQNNVPRFDHNPTTGAALGLEIEEQRTNSLTYSEDFANAAWSKTRSSITSNTIVAPDGTLTGDKLVEDTQTGQHHVNVPSVSFTSGTSYTLSGYYKAAERTRVQLQLGGGTPFPTGSDHRAFFDLTTGTLVSAGASLTGTSITPVGNGWYRCSITAEAQATATDQVFFAFLISTGTTSSYTGDGYSGIFIWGAQLEAGAFATSYIPTTTTALTRSADAASMTGTNFSDWFNAAEGTLFVSAQLTEIVALKSIYEINDNTTSNHLRATVNAGVSTPIFQVSNVTAQAAITLGSAALNVFLMTNAYKVDDFSAALNGTLGTPDTSGSLPTVTQLTIGRRITDRYLNGYIQRIVYWPVRLANSQLQALTG